MIRALVPRFVRLRRDWRAPVTADRAAAGLAGERRTWVPVRRGIAARFGSGCSIALSLLSLPFGAAALSLS
jgi:hypothetical protein